MKRFNVLFLTINFLFILRNINNNILIHYVSGFQLYVSGPDTKIIYTNNKLTMKWFLVIYSIKT